MGSDDNMVKVIKKFKLYDLTLMNKYFVSNVSLLQAHRIPIESIQKRILQRSSCFIHKTTDFKNILIQVEEKWGVSLCSSVTVQLPGLESHIGLMGG